MINIKPYRSLVLCSAVFTCAISFNAQSEVEYITQPELDLETTIPMIDGIIVAHFTWTMPKRTIDVDNDGLIDSYREQADEIAAPADGWRVDFNACGTEVVDTTKNPKLLYEWTIDDNEPISSKNLCEYSLRFPEEGVYQVTLRAYAGSGNYIIGEVTHDVTVQDWLIVAIGDSYASGEGNPDFTTGMLDFAGYTDDLGTQFGDILDDIFGGVSGAGSYVLDELIEKVNRTQDNLEKLQTSKEDLDEAVDDAVDACLTINFSWENCAAAINDVNTKIFEAGFTAVEVTIAELTDDIETVGDLFDGTIKETEKTLETAKKHLERYVDDLENLFDTQVVWKDERCHRSAHSGQARAALQLENEDQKTSVTFLHLACSGATIESGLIGPYNGLGYKRSVDDNKRPGDCDSEKEVYVKNDLGHSYCMLKPQIQRIQELVGDREIDALLVSIGGNDVNFAPIVMSCMGQEPCYGDYPLLADYPFQGMCASYDPTLVMPFVKENCNHQYADLPEVKNALCPFHENLSDLYEKCRNYRDSILEKEFLQLWLAEREEGATNPITPFTAQNAKQLANAGFSGDPYDDHGAGKIQKAYQDLHAKIGAYLPNFEQNRVFITEYPSAVRDENESFCGSNVGPEELLGITSDESSWIEASLLIPLNEEIAKLNEDYNWNVVTGIFDKSYSHGYCADNSWIRRLQDSFLLQQDQNGSVHPTIEGHKNYQRHIYPALRAALYHGSTPRSPVVLIPGDLNQDSAIDMSDYQIFSSTFGKCVGSSGYHSAADFDGDQCITFVDYQRWYYYYQNQ
jgi:hypothetical protein